MPIIEITAPDDPRIADYVGVREAELRRDRYDAPGGLFVAEGELVVRRLAASRYATRSLLLTPTRLATVHDVVDALPAETPVYLVSQAVMNDIVGFNIHRGVLALGIRGPEPDLDSILRHARVAIVLEDLVNHDNIGAIFRNTAALAGLGTRQGGAEGGAVLLSPKCADPLYRKAIRVSAGWALGVPYARLSDWPGDLSRVRAAGYRLVGLHPRPNAIDIKELAAQLAANRQPVALVVGTEGAGLSPGAVHSVDTCVQIPMPGQVAGVDSLNVGVATAIALHRIVEASSGSPQDPATPTT